MSERRDSELEKEPMTEALEKYIEEHSDSEPSQLHALSRDAWLSLVNPQMVSGHIQGRLLKMFIRMLKPKRVLELGTYAAYATLAMAEGLEEDAVLHTIEIFDELEDFITKQLKLSEFGDRVVAHFGDAADVLPMINDKPFDLVFIDANKRDYCEYYEMVFPIVAPGGFIIADNTLWYGRVADASCRDDQTVAIRKFNDIVAADERVEKLILPVRDGITIIYKKP